MMNVATSADTATLLDRARHMRPLLQERAAETDALRRLPDEVVAALKEAGLCRLMVPRRLGGYETSIRTYMETIAELGRGCGSTAWVASLLNVCAWLAALFPERAQRDVWGSDPDAWIAGSLAPQGEATPVDGGWRVNGRWPWASGCLHANLDALVRAEPGDEVAANRHVALEPFAREDGEDPAPPQHQVGRLVAARHRQPPGQVSEVTDRRYSLCASIAHNEEYDLPPCTGVRRYLAGALPGSAPAGAAREAVLPPLRPAVRAERAWSSGLRLRLVDLHR